MVKHKRLYHKGSLVWPLILIGFGIIFLLNNLGALDWDVWFLVVRLWPLLLIAVGLDVLLGRRPGIWAALTVFIIIGLFVGGVWLIRSTRSVWTGELNTVDIVQKLDNATSAEVELIFGVGELEVRAMGGSNNLVEGILDLTKDENLTQDFSIINGTAYFNLESAGMQFYPSWLVHDRFDDPRKWRIELNDSIPIDLDIRTGVSYAVIDLRDMNLTNVEIDTGVGETIVYLPSSGRFAARISGGVGSLRVYVPVNLAVRIHIDDILGNTSVSGGYYQSGNIFYSENYETAENRIELYLNGGIGEIQVIQIER